MSKRFPRRTREDYILDSIIAVLGVFVFLVCFYPFYLAIVLSFNEGLDAARGGIWLIPRKFTLDNYASFFSDSNWLRAFFVTVTRTLIGTCVSTLFTSFVAYGLSKRTLVFRKFYMGVIVLCMYFSGGLIPYYLTLRTLGLLNSFWVYIIPTALNLFYTLIAISFFQELPEALYESAILDGAGEFRVLASIVLPLSLPLLATIAIFTGVQHWSAWQDSAFYVHKRELRTLGYHLMDVIKRSNTATSEYASAMAANSQVTPMAVQVTAMVIAVAPILFIYPFLQKYFVTGLTVGSVKG